MGNPSLEGLEIIGNDAYARAGYPHEAWAILRREAPVYWYERPSVEPPFSAVTKHADVVAVSRRPELFRNAPRLAVFPDFPARDPKSEPPARHLLNMEPPDHAGFRRVASHRFTPRALRRLFTPTSTRSRARPRGGDPGRARRARLRGAGRRAHPPGGAGRHARRRARGLGAHVPLDQRDDRRHRSRVPAGRDRPGDRGALAQRPLRLLHAHGRGAPQSARRRRRERDRERPGRRSAAPALRSLCLFYPSANRDEEAFDAPFEFRADRSPNRHLAFGIGEHFCLGANLARAELRSIFRQLAARVEHVELAGPVERLRSSFVGGIKHMPIRWRLR